MTMNKKFVKVLLLFVLFFAFFINAHCEETTAAKRYVGPVAETFCQDTAKTWKYAGYLVLIAKVAIPAIIIFYASFDFFNTVKSGKDSDLKKDAITFAKRVGIGIFVFLLPTLVSAVVDFTSGKKPGDYVTCINCITSPSSCVVSE